MMKKEKKTNAGLAREVASLHKQLVTLRYSEAERRRAEEELQGFQAQE